LDRTTVFAVADLAASAPIATERTGSTSTIEQGRTRTVVADGAKTTLTEHIQCPGAIVIDNTKASITLDSGCIARVDIEGATSFRALPIAGFWTRAETNPLSRTFTIGSNRDTSAQK
jgi:hypothetical protein